jgi:hypothetical protein
VTIKFFSLLKLSILRTLQDASTKYDYMNNVTSVVLTIINAKNTAFWDVTPCSLAQMYQHLGGIYCHHLEIEAHEWRRRRRRRRRRRKRRSRSSSSSSST